MTEDHFKEGYKLLDNVVKYWNQLDDKTKYSNLSEAKYHMKEVDNERSS